LQCDAERRWHLMKFSRSWNVNRTNVSLARLL
jgi:hypothetical protein